MDKSDTRPCIILLRYWQEVLGYSGIPERVFGFGKNPQNKKNKRVERTLYLGLFQLFDLFRDWVLGSRVYSGIESRTRADL